jgi:hypothetical protein
MDNLKILLIFIVLIIFILYYRKKEHFENYDTDTLNSICCSLNSNSSGDFNICPPDFCQTEKGVCVARDVLGVSACGNSSGLEKRNRSCLDAQSPRWSGRGFRGTWSP